MSRGNKISEDTYKRYMRHVVTLEDMKPKEGTTHYKRLIALKKAIALYLSSKQNNSHEFKTSI